MQRTLWFILGIYVLLSIACSVVVPLFEAPDENHHYFAAQQIADTGELPVASESVLSRQEAAQPPLYYLIASLIISPIDTSEAEKSLWFNSFVRLGFRESVINVNACVHTAAEDWPWRGFALAAHLVRFFSILLGLGTLVCTYASGRLLWPTAPERALLATALVAFLPQYVFQHSVVTNDALIIFLCSAALWQSIQLWLGGENLWRILALGLTVGLAMTTKTTGVLLVVFTTGLIVLLVWRSGKWSLLARDMGLLIVPAVLLSGWVYWRNWTLYRDVLAVNKFIELAGGDRHFTVRQALSDVDRVWKSSFAVFGWGTLVAPRWVYAIWNGLLALGGLGFLVGSVRALRERSIRRSPEKTSKTPFRERRLLLIPILATWPLLVFASWLQFMMRTPADQGRLLFPAILPVSLAVAYGLSQWHRRWAFPAASLLALVTAVYCVGFLLPQAYSRPALIDEVDIPPHATRLYHDMGLGLELVASEVGTWSARPGDSVDLVLYWRTQGGATAPALVSPEIVGREYTQIARLPKGYHGGGLYPSTLWPRDRIVREHVTLRLADDVTTPTQGRILVHLDGQEEYVEAGSIKVVPEVWPGPSWSIVARLGDGIALTQSALGMTTGARGEAVPVDLRWQISAAPGKDLTTFVHLGDLTQPPLAQADGPAIAGDYPSRFWEVGEVFNDQYTLPLPQDIPAGRYPVHVGLYDPDTGQRLPVWIDDVRQPHDAYLVGWITVE
jgi:4-amino-4-deoxy-L-arabinose transferase-like glycosyltransferase